MKREALGSSKKNMSRKIFCFALCAMLLALSFPVQAQQSGKMRRIGYFSGTGDPSDPGPNFESLRQALRDLGHTDGRNIDIEYRGAIRNLDHVPGLLAELVELKPDVLIVETLTAIHAAKRATQTIPIVMVTTQEPVATGIIESLARPGGNITGVTTLSRELSGKRLELLKEVIPGMSRVGVLSGNPTSLGNAPIKNSTRLQRMLLRYRCNSWTYEVRTQIWSALSKRA